VVCGVAVLGACAEGATSGPAVCGNGLREGTEQCDGIDLGTTDCAALNQGSGSLRCKSDCTYDLAGCSVGTVCGNSLREGAEYCDGNDLGGKICSDLNLGTGLLSCTAGCQFDTSGCTLAAVCGNGVIEGSEACDGPNLGTKTCANLGQGFGGGTLTCTATCQLDTAGCTTGAVCGNGLVEAGESCDGNNFGGATCVTLGFLGGQLGCSGACTLMTSGCTNAAAESCTNGVDDDLDGLVDCQDGDCSSNAACGGTPENCTDGLDNDQDGAIDCGDLDCQNHPSCQGPTAENCTNGIDDDQNFLCDCDDVFACLTNLTCLLAGPETNCTDGLDNDHDCRVDCDDDDCASDPACGGVVEDCVNGVDDDGDGAVDCADTACANHPSCPLCTPVTTIVCGDQLSGTTAGRPILIDGYGCADWDDTGPEAFYLFTAPSSGSVTVTLTPTSVDLDLIVFTQVSGDCRQGQCVNASQGTGAETVTFSATSGAAYYLIVDGYSNASGAFTLRVTCP
jgi:hypothetical protein